MIKKAMAFSRFLKCDASEGQKAKALIKYTLCAGKKDVTVGDNVFKITKLRRR